MKTINLNIIKCPLPDEIKGVCIKKKDSYTVAINDGLEADQQARAFLHEMLHIYNGDFDKGNNANRIETESHKQFERIMEV